MFATAQHVLSATVHDDGVNTFLYLHGAHVWEGLPPAGIPDDNPGELFARTVAVTPGGNRIRSYLDVICPDATPAQEIRRSFVTFAAEYPGNPFPWMGVVGRCVFRVNMESALAADWHRELATLYHAVESIVGERPADWVDG